MRSPSQRRSWIATRALCWPRANNMGIKGRLALLPPLVGCLGKPPSRLPICMWMGTHRNTSQKGENPISVFHHQESLQHWQPFATFELPESVLQLLFGDVPSAGVGTREDEELT